MTRKRSGETPGSQYTVHLNDAKGVVFGDHAVQHNRLSGRATGLVAAALALVLLSDNNTLVESARPAPPTPAALPGPTATPSVTKTPTPGPSPTLSPSSSPTRPAPPPAPPPTVRAPSPPASSTPPADPPPKPSPTRACRSRQQYRLNNRAQVWDAEGARIGEATSGTLFFRQESASYPTPVDDRYYGTVDEVISGSATGYVLRKKLDYVGTVEICD
ncbi:hypothetical protein [Streptomyces liangshanensis]|uniref:Uncharacterized protein n=1 Tax=Streptomyces liangshanensis TaxID=2717324 RepID=A0A6G9GU08_9ACTN|nr:hypothetical protein [Streptomyces liangshanensis]QIQ01705.1 hypothetical protein HA039_04865 [Streptomyces liangshanensis]